MDLKGIAAATRAYNFHTHTQFCDGRNTVEEMARAAADAGILHLGFTPHSPIPIESPCNMAESDLPAYFSEIARMKNELEGRINIYTGLEKDYLGSEFKEAESKFGDLKFDYTIGSVHFIPAPGGEPVDIDGRFENFKVKMEHHFDNDIRYVVETFYSQSHAMLADGGFDILGHFDKIAQNASYFRPGIENETWYRTLIDDYIDDIIARDFIVEINTKAREQHGRFFPHERYWKRLADAGLTLIVNSDAHYVDRIVASRDEAFVLLDKIQKNA